MKLPPLDMAGQGVGDETKQRAYNRTNEEQVFATLRREILAARLKVTLDEQLGRATSPTAEGHCGNMGCIPRLLFDSPRVPCEQDQGRYCCY
jgi:hypothetical protein